MIMNNDIFILQHAGFYIGRSYKIYAICNIMRKSRPRLLQTYNTMWYKRITTFCVRCSHNELMKQYNMKRQIIWLIDVICVMR